MFDKLKKVFGGGGAEAPKGEPIPREESEPKSYVAKSGSPPPSEPPSGGAPAETAVREVQDSPLRGEVIAALKRVYDPEIPVDIWELGLIYAVRISEEGDVDVDMTLTSPHCPSAEELPGDAEKRIRAVEGVREVKVGVVWEPPWDKDKMSEVAKLELGME